jgi:transposase
MKKLENIQEILKLHKQGLNIKKLAKRFSTSQGTILDNFKACDYNPILGREEYLKEKYLNKLINLHKQGKSTKELGKEFGLCEGTVRKWFKEVEYKYKIPLIEQIKEECLKENMN